MDEDCEDIGDVISLRVTGWRLRVEGYGLRVEGYGLRVGWLRVVEFRV
jgi:hypothetical protein